MKLTQWILKRSPVYDLHFSSPALTTLTMVRQTWIAMNKAVEARLAKIGLTPEQLAVLWICRDYPGTVIPAEIARLLFRENQTIAGLLRRMERERLITRITKRKGQPFTEVKIAPKGRDLVGPGVAIVKELVTEFGSPLSDEQHDHAQSLIAFMRNKALEKLNIAFTSAPVFPAEKPIPVNW